MTAHKTRFGLVGDIGGTNARFAYAQIDAAGVVALSGMQNLVAADYQSLDAALAAFCRTRPTPPLDFVGLACAGPVRDAAVTFTNLPWTARMDQISRSTGADRVCLINDLAAQAWSVPALGGNDLAQIGPDVPQNAGEAGAPVAVFGVGTGTNVAVHIAGDNDQEHVFGGEGGHVGFAPHDDQDMAIWQHLTARFGRVSVERVASGPGLVNIYEAICSLNNLDPVCKAPAMVVEYARRADPIAEQALYRFCAVLGSIAGDFALSFGARGGIYISGGIAPGLIDILNTGVFRQRFEAKGRFQSYMAMIPTYVILNPFSALLGAARAAR